MSMPDLLKKMCATVLSDARTFKFVYDPTNPSIKTDFLLCI